MYDFAIAGAGPAGLSAAITAAQLGNSVIVIEKGPVAGPEPRGESMPHHALFDDLVHPDFLKGISSFVSTSRRFHSPGARKNTLVRLKESYYFFNWRDFIGPVFKKAISLGVEFIFDAEVRTAGDSGLVYFKDDIEHVVKAKAVLGCGGRSCPVAAGYNIDTKATACPTVKYRGRMNEALPKWLTAMSGEPDLQFFTVLPNSMKSVDYFPPAFAYVFPLGNGHIEAGLMLRLSQFEKMKKTRMPSDDEIMTAWIEVKNSLPGFSDFFSDTTTEYEKLTSIQNRRFINNNIITERNAVLIGDAVGMVDANGSAGLYYAMAHGSSWVRMLSKAMSNEKEIWTDKQTARYYKEQSGWDFYRYIRGSFRLISIFERIIFRTFGTEKKLNFIWSFISTLIKANS